MRYVFLFIVYNVGKLYPTLEQNGRPLLTPSSLVAYCLFLVYGFMLVNDYQGRPSPSFYANEFMDSRMRKTIYDHLLRCYVPSFMMPIFHGLSDTSDPRRTGLEYFPTLAASVFDIDFGRLLPPQAFLFAHNMSCENDTSRNVQAAVESLLSWNVFLNNAENANIYVGQYFSAGTENGSYRSWMYSTLDLLFSPVTGKSILRRTNIQEIPCFNMSISADHSDADRIHNPYIIFLNASDNNAYHTAKFLTEFSAIAKADLNGTFQLGAIPDDQSGVAILNHGYSIYAVPTWHNSKFVLDKIYDVATTNEYVQKIKYLQQPSVPANFAVPQPKDFTDGMRRLYLSLSSTAHKGTDEPKSDKSILFDQDTHEHPNTLYLLPYEEGDTPISYAMLCGLKIESFELDGASVPNPNPLEKLSDNNSQYGQGGLPLTNVVKGFGTADEMAITPLPRAKLRKLYQQVSLDLYDLSQNRLGYVDGTVADTAIPDPLPGFTVVNHVRSFKMLYSKISFKFGSAPPIGSRRLPVWSPYRVIYNEQNSAPLAANIYMLTNFRTMYGTHIPLVETDAPSALIPTS